MDEGSFWRLVEACRREGGSDSERVVQLILRRLRTLSAEEILIYEQMWFRAQDMVFTWPIRDAATLMLGQLDNDFLAVQDWIVSHGRVVIDRITSDPDCLVELVADRHNARIDWFCGLPVEAHISATGAPPPMGGPDGLEEPSGMPTDLGDEQQARRSFPRIVAYLEANPWITRPWALP